MRFFLSKYTHRLFSWFLVFGIGHFLVVPLPLSAQQKNIKTYTIVVDPGHGGAPGMQKVDKWDPVTQKYLSRFLYGGVYKSIHEHKIMLDLAKRVHYYLNLSQSDAGWEKFSRILTKFSGKQNHQRVRFEAHLTRTNSYTDFQYPKGDPRSYEPYLLYDYPDRKSHRIKKGRISYINELKPSLVVSLHTTPAGGRQPGGMAAVLAPGYQTFETIRKISMSKLPVSRFNQMPWYKGWLVTDRGWTKYEAARSDAWVYFHGYKTKKGKRLQIWKNKYRSVRHNLVHWRYADPPGWEKLARLDIPGPYATNHNKFEAVGPFWDRERSIQESWRREGGIMGYGGDNHYASDELMRFVQHGSRLLTPALRKKNAIGPIINPFVSTFSLPTFTNAVVAYLEIAHHNRSNDVRLVSNYREQVAQSLAAGIYSLYEGLPLKNQYAPYKPRTQKLDFEKYTNHKDGNYFLQAIK